MTETVERRSTLTLAAFAAPCLPLSALGLPLVVHLPAYYHSVLGLSLSAVSTAWLVVRLLDLAFDPLFGGVMDRTRSRWGRFRFWLTLGTPVVLLGAWLMFMAEPGVTVPYLWAGLVIIYVGQSMTTLAQMSWAAVLSPNYNERSRVYGWWQAANVLGSIIVLALPAFLEKFGDLSRAQGVQVMGWLVIIFLPLTVALALFKVPEPQVTADRDRAGISEYLALFKRKSVQRLLAADIIINTGPAVTGSLFFFYFLTIKQFNSADAGLLLLFYFVGAFAGGPLWVRVSYRLGKHQTLALAAGIYALTQIGVVLMPAGQFAVAGVMMFAAGLPFSAGPFLLRSMMADVADEERLLTRKDRTGLLYAILTGSIKIGSAIAVFGTFQLLSIFGFQDRAGAENTDAALTALQVTFTVLPAVFGLATAAIILRYPLTAARQVEIRRALDERDLADAAPEFGEKPRFSEELHVPIAKPLPAGE